MSIICAAVKNGTAAISSDSQSNSGDLKIHARHLSSPGKLYAVNGSVMGIVGWKAIANIIEHMILTDRGIFRMNSPVEIMSTLLDLHAKMKETYFIETKEEEDQPVESNQLDALIINKHGVFDVGSYRSVTEIATYWAIGSGRELALGAMHALYGTKASAKAVVEAGVSAAAAFEKSCGLPLKTRTISTRRK